MSTLVSTEAVPPTTRTSTADLRRASDRLAEMPPRFHVGTERPGGAVSWAELLESETLKVHIHAHAAARNTADLQIAASLFVQGMAMYVLGASMAAEFVHGIRLRATPDDLWVVPGHPTVVWGITPSDGRDPNEVQGAPGATIEERVNAWIDHWPAGHLAELINAVRSNVKVGRRMLEGNVSSATAANLVFLDWWTRSADIGRVSKLVMSNPVISRHVSMTDVTVQGRTGMRSERTSCCLLLRIDGSHACPTCPMVSAEERIATTTNHVGHLLQLRPLAP